MRQRIAGILAATLVAVTGLAVAAAPAAAGTTQCVPIYVNGQRCDVFTTGRSGSGASGETGYATIYITWQVLQVDGSICVADTWANGRGVKVNLNAHRTGEPVDNNQAHYVNLGTWASTGNCAYFQFDSGYVNTGINFIYVNWADFWSGCDYCYMGTYTAKSPLYPNQ